MRPLSTSRCTERAPRPRPPRDPVPAPPLPLHRRRGASRAGPDVAGARAPGRGRRTACSVTRAGCPGAPPPPVCWPAVCIPRRWREAVRRTGARIVHAHNLHPTFGWRSLAAARAAGARVVLHLHQYRLVCAIGVCFRDGAECTRCHGRNTAPGVALNCRGSRAEALAYGAGLALWQRRLVEHVDAFVVPSRFAGERLRELGAPIDAPFVVPHVTRQFAAAVHGSAVARPRRWSPRGWLPRRAWTSRSKPAGSPGSRWSSPATARSARRLERRRRSGPAREHVQASASPAGSTMPSWRAAGGRRRRRRPIALGARRSGWPRPRRWPPDCPSPPRGSARCLSSCPTTGWRAPGDPAALAAVITRLRGDRGAGDGRSRAPARSPRRRSPRPRWRPPTSAPIRVGPSAVASAHSGQRRRARPAARRTLPERSRSARSYSAATVSPATSATAVLHTIMVAINRWSRP